MRLLFCCILLLTSQMLSAFETEDFWGLKGYTVIDIATIEEVNSYQDVVTLSNGMTFQMAVPCRLYEKGSQIVIFFKEEGEERSPPPLKDPKILEICDKLNRELQKEGFPEPVIYKEYYSDEATVFQYKVLINNEIFEATLLLPNSN